MQAQKYAFLAVKCSYRNCGGMRPSWDGPKLESEPVPKPAVKVVELAPAIVGVGNVAAIKKLELPTGCAWEGCSEGRRKRSKYCSRACSNKNAAARAKA